MNTNAIDSSLPDQTMLDNFRGILIYDVISALERAERDNTESAKRDLVRTIFVAIEGLVWTYREHVRSIAQDVSEITPAMEMVFSEQTYFISETGEYKQQTRFISLTAMIRYATRVAQGISPGLSIDFGETGWSDLQKAIGIRNRITHPKCKSDLDISGDDIKTVTASLFWLLELIQEVMSATNTSARNYLDGLRFFSDKLASGDKIAWSLYQEARASLEL